MLLRESVRFNLFFANSCTPTPHYMPHYTPRAHAPLSRLQMGVSADSNQKAFSATDITAFLARDPVVFHRNVVSEWSRDNVNHVVVAVDPAGGGASAFAIASMAQLGNGTVVVRARALYAQFPSRSPANICENTMAIVTWASGAWHDPFKKLGSRKGSTRVVRSCVSSGSVSLKKAATSGSRFSAKSTAASLHTTVSCVGGPKYANRSTSRAASRVASLDSPYVFLSRLLIPTTCSESTRSRSSMSRSLFSGSPSNKNRNIVRVTLVCVFVCCTQLIGIDSLRSRDVRSTHRAVLGHVAAIRRIRHLEDVTIVFSLESNLAYEAQHLTHAFTQAGLKKWLCLSEGAGGSLGWLTTNERKESMMFALRDALAVGSIALAKDFFCLTQPKTAALNQVEEELRAYSVLIEPPKTPFGKSKKTYTGKLGGRNDDVAIAIQLAIQSVRMFYQSPRYATWRGPQY